MHLLQQHAMSNAHGKPSQPQNQHAWNSTLPSCFLGCLQVCTSLQDPCGPPLWKPGRPAEPGEHAPASLLRSRAIQPQPGRGGLLLLKRAGVRGGACQSASSRETGPRAHSGLYSAGPSCSGGSSSNGPHWNRPARVKPRRLGGADCRPG